MTHDQALVVLDQAASRAPLTRADHEAVLRALAVLRGANKKKSSATKKT